MSATGRALALAAFALFAPSLAVASDAFPARNVTMVVPYAPGGIADTTARIVAPALEKIWQKPVVIENRPGTAAAIAGVARADPDGHTILMALSSITVMPESMKASGQKPAYEMAQLVPIAMFTADPSILLVRPDAPWKTAADLIAEAKKRPGEVSYASSGTFGSSHITAELMAKTAGVKLLHVPYRGGAPSMAALLSKDVDFTIQSPTVANQNVAAGNARALGAVAATRARSMSSVPSFKEQGLDVDILIWSALFVSAETPAALRSQILETVKQAMATEELRKRLEASGAEIRFMHGPELEKYIARDEAEMAQLVKDISLKN
jgi:tripartite-type tricarboxylate transporter receptor subunit TctC